MSYSPPILDWHTLTLTPMSAAGGELGTYTGNGSPASTVWTTANKAIIIPFYVRVGVTARQGMWVNGAAVSGNVDMGIYAENLTKIWSAGSTAQAGVSIPQSVTITGGQYLARGRYYMAIVLDNGVGTLRRFTGAAAIGNANKFMGLMEMASAFPLPATLVLAASTLNYFPNCGFNLTSLAL